MNKLYLIIYTLMILSACNQLKSSNAPKDFEDIDTLSQTTDSIKRNKSLNDIRFDSWEDSDWLDNEYIRTLRKYLDDYNNGIVSNPDLDLYKELIKGQFIVYEIKPFILGGVFIRIVFFNMPDRIFSSLLKTVDIRSPKTGISVHYSYSLLMAMQIY